MAAGRPLRTEEEIAEIYDEQCSPCEYFDNDSCGLCGCHVRREGTTLNKLAWGTEKCPDDPPKWVEKVIPDDAENASEEDIVLAQIDFDTEQLNELSDGEERPPSSGGGCGGCK